MQRAFQFLSAGCFLLGTGVPLLAQQTPAKAGLSERELAGKKLFLQRCSICHMPPLYAAGDAQPYGPRLDGAMKGPETETRVRETIRNGTARMPGFQYGLQPGEIEDIIAYLKTMKAVEANEGRKSGGSQNPVAD